MNREIQHTIINDPELNKLNAMKVDVCMGEEVNMGRKYNTKESRVSELSRLIEARKQQIINAYNK